MHELTYTLVSDGSSDIALMPLIDWLLRTNGVRTAIQRQWADFRRLRRPPGKLESRITTAVELYPCDLLFIHRDAESETYDFRHREITRAVNQVKPNVASVCVIPVHMHEAWLLFDEDAIRKASGNPSGTIRLSLPPIHKCENLPDPKNLLYSLLRTATELNARRQATAPVGMWTHRVAEYIDDFSPLRDLQAFKALEVELQQVIEKHCWGEVTEICD